MSGVRSVAVCEYPNQRRHRIAWLGAAVADLWLKRHDLEDLLVDGSLSLVSCTRVIEHMTDEVCMFGEPVRRLVHAGEFCSIANTRGTRTCRLWVGPAKVWKRSPVKTTDAANCGDVVARVLNYSVNVAFLAFAWFFVRRGRRFLIGHLSQIAHPPRLTCHRRIFGTPQRRKQRRIAKLTQVQHTPGVANGGSREARAVREWSDTFLHFHR